MNSPISHKDLQSGLRVEIIDSHAAFLAAETAWKALEDRDPELTFFLSWDWLAQAFHDKPFQWSVLAVRAADGEGYVGLLPLKYGLHWSRTHNEFQTEIEAGGRLLFSEYTGFLCDPACEQAVIDAMARALRAMPWSRLSLRYVAQQQRAARFCAAFERHGYRVSWKDYRINGGATNNLVCPQVALPDDFETYLQSGVSANTRQRYRRFKRQFFADGTYHFTHSDSATLDRDVATLMHFWKQKWGGSKGADKAAKVATNFANVLAAAARTDALFLPILWRGETPLGALGHVMDPKIGAMHFIIAGRDPAAEEPFIGAALHFHSIECSILLGCQSYDFGHGDEAYKFSYGAAPREVSYFSIRRPERGEGQVFDSISTGAALRRIEGFLIAGRTDDARRACRQLSRVFST